MSRRYGGSATCTGCGRSCPKTSKALCVDCRSKPRPCPGCGQPFVTLRENTFCSVACNLRRFNSDLTHQSTAGMANRKW